MNSIPCLTWIKRGVAKSQPDRVRLDDDELEKIMKKATLHGDTDEDSDDESAPAPGTSDSKSRKRKIAKSGGSAEQASGSTSGAEDDIAAKYGLDKYDDDEEEDEEESPLDIGGISYYKSNKDDPYIDKEPDSDEDDLKIMPSDNLLAIGRVLGDYCNLEVYIYNEDDDNLYCHHDIILPSFPLALEWLDFGPSDDKPGNFLAMGTMEPTIDIWDMDIVDNLQPAFTLGQESVQKKKKKRGTVGGHTDAVLDLSWNCNQRNVLASASADFTVGLWDLNQGTMLSALTKHTEKVQAVQWHPVEPQTLLSGSFDHTVKLYDCRSPDNTNKSWDLGGEVERVLWNHQDPFYFFASTDKGFVYYMDVRMDDKVFTLKAHTGAVTGLALSTDVAGCLVTASADKFLKVWDIRTRQPKMVFEKDLKMGAINCASYCPDSGYILAIGGGNELRVLSQKKNADIVKWFSKEPVSDAPTAEQPEQTASVTEEKDESESDVSSVTSSTAGPGGDAATSAKAAKKKKKKKKTNKYKNF